MHGRETVEYWERRGLVLLGTSLLAGVVAWGLSLEIGYALVKWACRRQQPYILAAVPGAGLAVVVAAAAIGWSCFAKARAIADERGGTLVDSSFFVAQVVVGLNLLLALMILTWVLLPFMLSPCE
jgi:hypothetical protein